MRRTNPLIVGGGPAGALAAIKLAEAGQRPLLLERSAAPKDIVCGGFLGGDALASLHRAGIDTAALGAHPVGTLHLVAGRRRAVIDLPFVAAGLSRAALDAALLARAAEQGAKVERGVTVRTIDAEDHIVRTSGGEIQAQAIFLATGKHDVRSMPRAGCIQSDPVVGIRVRLAGTDALRRALEHRIELILFDRGYAGLILQEDGSANLCLTVGQSRLDQAGGNRATLLHMLTKDAPILGERVAQSNGLSGWASVARVPYGWRTGTTRPGLFRLGDQAAVIASLAGDGIAIAFESAALAARHYLAEGPNGAVAFQKRFAASAWRPLWIADRLRGLAERGELAPAGIALFSHLPAVARAVTRMTRISGY